MTEDGIEYLLKMLLVAMGTLYCHLKVVLQIHLTENVKSPELLMLLHGMYSFTTCLSKVLCNLAGCVAFVN